MTALLDETVPARAPWVGTLDTGRTLEIIDLGGNQAVDCLLYNRHDREERYSAADTVAAQRNIFVVPGTALRSNEGRVMATVLESGCERHDTIGGACSRESNTLRYGHHTLFHHACRENFLREGAKHGLGLLRHAGQRVDERPLRLRGGGGRGGAGRAAAGRHVPARLGRAGAPRPPSAQ